MFERLPDPSIEASLIEQVNPVILSKKQDPLLYDVLMVGTECPAEEGVDTIPDILADLLHRKRGNFKSLEGVVDRCHEVGPRVGERAVQIEDQHLHVPGLQSPLRSER
jgi:hypothetical protein